MAIPLGSDPRHIAQGLDQLIAKLGQVLGKLRVYRIALGALRAQRARQVSLGLGGALLSRLAHRRLAFGAQQRVLGHFLGNLQGLQFVAIRQLIDRLVEYARHCLLLHS